MRSEAFTTQSGAWKVILDGEVLPTEWNSKGAALTGAQVEMRRRSLQPTDEELEEMAAEVIEENGKEDR